MDADKFANLQLQMRENQQELQDYLSDLNNWEDDIAAKDQSLKSQKVEKSPELPPIRNSLSKKKKKKLPVEVEKKSKRISSYDYRSWDKFDIEKACADVDDEGEKSESSGSETDEEWENERRRQQGMLEKDKGNQYFKEGNYCSAIECYSKGIECDASNTLLYANRAMALLKQRQHAAAEVDCSSAITLDPTYVKAYIRRGTARMALNKLQEAKKDFERSLTLEPGNKMAKKELDVIEQKLNPPPFSEVDADTGIVKPIYKTPETRSKAPLQRITIEEIGIDNSAIMSSIAKTESSQSDMKHKLREKDSADFDKLISKKPTTHNKPNDGETVNIQAEGLKKSEQTCSKIIELKNVESKSVIEKVDVVQPERKKLQVVKSNSEVSHELSSVLPPPPQNSYQLQRDLKLLQNEELFHQYIQKIEPEHYPSLFGQFLDSEILLKLLNCMKKYYAHSECDIFLNLKWLSKVKRFAMIVMFMSADEKKVIKDLFQLIEAQKLHDPSEIESLRKVYGV